MAWGAIIGGAAQIAGSLIGGRARRREQKAAQAQQAADLDKVRNFEFKDEYKGLENVYEDATVNQQAANFQAAQTDQALAAAQQNIVESGAGGGGGAAALVAGALESKQGISNQIAAQEQANQANRLQAESDLQSAKAASATDLQSQRFEQNKGNLNLSSARLNTANAARQAATNQLVGGISSIANAGEDTLKKAGSAIGGVAGKIGGFLGF